MFILSSQNVLFSLLSFSQHFNLQVFQRHILPAWHYIQSVSFSHVLTTDTNINLHHPIMIPLIEFMRGRYTRPTSRWRQRTITSIDNSWQNRKKRKITTWPRWQPPWWRAERMLSGKYSNCTSAGTLRRTSAMLLTFPKVFRVTRWGRCRANKSRVWNGCVHSDLQIKFSLWSSSSVIIPSLCYHTCFLVGVECETRRLVGFC